MWGAMAWNCPGWLPGFLVGHGAIYCDGETEGKIDLERKSKCFIFDLLSLMHHSGLTNWLNKSGVSYCNFPMNKRMKLVSFSYWGISNNQTSLHDFNHKSLFLMHMWNVCSAAGLGWVWFLSACWALVCSLRAYGRLQAAYSSHKCSWNNTTLMSIHAWPHQPHLEWTHCCFCPYSIIQSKLTTSEPCPP